MKAAVLNRIGDSKLELRDDVDTTEPAPAEVRVRLRAAGICHSDLSAMNGTLPALAPGIIGHEGAGDVVAVGSAVTGLSTGDRVIISYVPPCGVCTSCLRGEANLCSVHPIAAYTTPRFRSGDDPIFGFAGCGTFAEEIVVPDVGAIKFDDDVPYEIAALVGCGVITGVGAVLNTAKMPPGSSVLVIGAGGVGISAVQGARLAGASRIAVVDPVVEKHELARKFGATHTSTPDGLAELRHELTADQGFDYAFEVVGKPATIRMAWDSARRGGTAVIVGAGRADEMVEFSAQELFLHEKKLLGSFYGSADVRTEYTRLIELWRAGLLDLESMISRRIRLPEINDGLEMLQTGKIIRQIVTFD